MKLHLVFLVCLFAGSWQQNPYFPYHVNPYNLGYPLYHNSQFLIAGNNPLPYSSAFIEEVIQQRNLALYRLLEAKGLLEINDKVNNFSITLKRVLLTPN